MFVHRLYTKFKLKCVYSFVGKIPTYSIHTQCVCVCVFVKQQGKKKQKTDTFYMFIHPMYDNVHCTILSDKIREEWRRNHKRPNGLTKQCPRINFTFNEFTYSPTNAYVCTKSLSSILTETPVTHFDTHTKLVLHLVLVVVVAAVFSMLFFCVLFSYCFTFSVFSLLYQSLSG